MAETEHCNVPGCERLAAASLDSHPLCRQHFISSCCAELEAYTRRLKENRLGEVLPESARRFVHQCARQADSIEQSARDLDDLERAQLLDLILRAAELGRHLRRSPRRVTSIPILVRHEEPGQPSWEEKTETQLITRYGALVKCQHPVEINERLSVVRMDNGQQAYARVAWCERKRRDQPDVGIEFLDCDNFWELDWSAAEPAV